MPTEFSDDFFSGVLKVKKTLSTMVILYNESAILFGLAISHPNIPQL